MLKVFLKPGSLGRSTEAITSRDPVTDLLEPGTVGFHKFEIPTIFQISSEQSRGEQQTEEIGPEPSGKMYRKMYRKILEIQVVEVCLIGRFFWFSDSDL
jgi:hypothetical protein